MPTEFVLKGKSMVSRKCLTCIKLSRDKSGPVAGTKAFARRGTALMVSSCAHNHTQLQHKKFMIFNSSVTDQPT